MNPQRVYQHNNPGRLIFGPKSVNELANEIPANEIPLVITDQGVAKSGILKRVTDVLEGAGILPRKSLGRPFPSFRSMAARWSLGLAEEAQWMAQKPSV